VSGSPRLNGHGPRLVVVGAGFSGAVLARELAEAGHKVEVFDQRDHVAGNCHTARDDATGVNVHVYGPHIFHTDDEEVWGYIRRFGEMGPYVNRVKAFAGGTLYSFPVNLYTINQFFGRTFTPDEARDYVSTCADRSIGEPVTFEEQALKMVGRELYEAFFKGYTVKQWGRPPTEIPASVLRRLPLRFTYDDNYYAHRHQGIPVDGYTAIVGRILDHPNISLSLGQSVPPFEPGSREHVFWTGPLDAWFGHAHGRLAYRTLDFERIEDDGDFQGNAVINYCDLETPYTRISEHKHFAPWESHARTIVYREYARECVNCDIPYYPIRLAHDKALLSRYIALARESRNVSFLGRLGTYRYLDMDVTIREALNAAAVVREALAGGRSPPPFFLDPA
jgi:UDP-galactopyranose mutase